MKAFFVYSLDGVEAKIIPCVVPHSKLELVTPVPTTTVRISAIAFVPTLFRMLAKDEAPGVPVDTHVAQIKSFDLREMEKDDREKMIHLLKCYYEFADEIRDGLSDGGLKVIFDEWDFGHLDPFVFSTFMPGNRVEALKWRRVFEEWFGVEDPVCAFWGHAEKEWFCGEPLEDLSELKN